MKRKLVSAEEVAEIITDTIRQHRLGGPGLAVTTTKILHYPEPGPDGSNRSCLMTRLTEDVPVEAIQQIWCEVMPELRRKYNLKTSAHRT